VTRPMPRVHPTVVHMLAAAAEDAPDREALVCGTDRLSYAAYARCVAGFARELRSLGAAGERVAVVLPNSADVAVATFAVHAAGAQCAALNPGYTRHELSPILEDARPRIAVVEAGGPADDPAMLGAAGVRSVVRIGPGDRRLTAWADGSGPGIGPDLLPDPGAPATLQYTGGTTGRSKGVELTHRAVSTNVSQREALLPAVPGGERVLSVAPLYHVYAVAMGLHLAAYARSTLVVMPRYRPDDLLRLLVDERITLFAGNPTLFIGLMASPAFASARFPDLRLCFSGSAALPEETLRRWEAATGVPVCEGYGQTEAGPVLTYNPADGVRKPGTVGVPLPLTEVQVVDAETGTRVLPPGEPGEIRARGPQLMTRYRGLPAETAAALRDGWLHTGDVGEFDADGYLTIRDRLKDMIVSGGFNVYPREVEEALHCHPAVLEAAVIGRPDAYRGEAAEAVVVLREGSVADADELLEHCRGRLARYKVPASVRFAGRLPRTPVGKIDKVALRRALN
jgi:long-chain acyl-CoA synthetase